MERGIQRILRRPARLDGGRLKWFVIGAAAALMAGAGPLPGALAMVTTGDRPVLVDVTPRRIADTRIDVGITNAVQSGVPKVLHVTGNVPIAPSGSATVVPTGATAVVLNVTVVNPTWGGYVAIRPGNPGSAPTTANLNFASGVTIGNQVTVGLPVGGGTDGDIQIWFQGGAGSTHIVVDVFGYYDNHRHDDRYYRESESRQLVLEHQTLTGQLVGSTGAANAPGPYTSGRTGIGKYTVAYDTVGAGIPPNEMPPNIVVSPSHLCPDGTMAMGGWAVYVTTTEVTSMAFNIETYSNAGAAVDCSVFFQISFGGHTSIRPDEPGTAAAIAAQSRPIECRNTESGTVCAPVD